MQAALETKLPVWLGVGCKKTEDGKIVSFDHADLEFATVLDALIPMGPTVVNIMHSEIGAIPEAIELVRQRWSGPIGVYPESGYFTKPTWIFVDVISPADLVTGTRELLHSSKSIQITPSHCLINTKLRVIRSIDDLHELSSLKHAAAFSR